MMKAAIRILLGGVYGYASYVLVLWFVVSVSPAMTFSGDQMREALYWPKNIYLYFRPGRWTETSLQEGVLTVGGATIILRGMMSARRKVKRDELAAAATVSMVGRLGH